MKPILIPVEGLRWVERMRFTVDGEPLPQPRPRRSIRGGVYTPERIRGWKEMVSVTAMFGDFPVGGFRGPVRVSVKFCMPRPEKLNAKGIPDGEILHPVKPDRDNLDKAILDALEAVGIFDNDSQVCAGEVCKVYHAKGETPRAQIRIETPAHNGPGKEA